MLWFHMMADSLKFLDRFIYFKHKGREVILKVNDKVHTIPIVSQEYFQKSIKFAIFVYMIFVKDSPQCVYSLLSENLLITRRNRFKSVS